MNIMPVCLVNGTWQVIMSGTGRGFFRNIRKLEILVKPLDRILLSMCSLGEWTVIAPFPGQHLCRIRDTIYLEHLRLVKQEDHRTGVIKDSVFPR